MSDTPQKYFMGWEWNPFTNETTPWFIYPISSMPRITYSKICQEDCVIHLPESQENVNMNLKIIKDREPKRPKIDGNSD